MCNDRVSISPATTAILRKRVSFSSPYKVPNHGAAMNMATVIKTVSRNTTVNEARTSSRVIS